MQYLNLNRFFEVNSEIIEWDIKSAGISLIQEYKMLPQAKIEKLLKLPKDNMNRSIGKIGQKDSNFARSLEEKFNDVVNIFIENNNLDIEYDIISIKRDAVFVINRKISKPTIGDFIRFVPKNVYHAYIYLKPYEFYIKANEEMDIKNLCRDINKRNEIIELHRNGILNFLNEAVNLCERTNMNRNQISKFCANFVKLYKNKQLDFDYYREFNIESMFKYVYGGNAMMLDNIDGSLIDNIDIQYNYINIILPMVNLMCI